jgi:hypothetical protein
MTGRKQRMESAFAALLSDDDARVLAALTRIEAQGDARAIRPLLHALARARDERAAQRIRGLLHQVKAPGAAEELLAALDDASLAPVRRDILAVVWNAGLDVRDHLERFIALATEGDAGIGFECLTIIEHTGGWPEQAVRSVLARLNDAAVQERDAYKASVLAGIRQALERHLGSGAGQPR